MEEKLKKLNEMKKKIEEKKSSFNYVKKNGKEMIKREG